jgi:hypothetical protein
MHRRCTVFATLLLPLWSTLLVAPTNAQTNQQHPDIIDVKVQARSANRFDFDVTLSSPYDTPQRYADAFRVVGSDGGAHVVA